MNIHILCPYAFNLFMSLMWHLIKGFHKNISEDTQKMLQSRNTALPWHQNKEKRQNTDSPLYTDTRYNDEIRYYDNLTVTKALLKR